MKNLQDLKMLNIHLLCDPAIPLQVIFPRKVNTCPLKAYEEILRAAIFNSLIFKPTQLPSDREQISELQYSHSIVNKLLLHTIIQRNQKNMMSKRSQTRKSTSFMIPLISSSKQVKLISSDRNENSGCLEVEEKKGH